MSIAHASPVVKKASGSSELHSLHQLRGKPHPGMAETRVVIDPCSEEQICSSKRQHMSDSRIQLTPCSCGPDCSPGKCSAQKNTSLVSWDDARTKIFLLLIGIFAVWMVIYIPISITSQNWEV